ncbi:MAG TPA: Gfo/Idh/MocA family oxidoreductase [Verrucomicrobiota bacterium]|nr:Gfo/Idh/MocA family oxidoreductase [Verrucomicrobiota bacterium]HOR71393.1 Gfo/Idh/MocA family oxidoreductase [Verrucomicrobiota bacterium]HOU87791.1 Gfo/Idh/MocA family oxidoreductase [Verrucomicrobiota bacterium]HPK97885.1 Gfo/Idh/MocA family oxidoreductase [Verrucomicrobiota bacterium]HQF59149.1 Gfo/Idh/MocA family oxidoreductase [Verrucomicrobiota bacterium]
MSQSSNLSRRSFLRTATATALATPLLLPDRIWSAESGVQPNSRVAMGFIGVGTQGRHLLNSFLPHGNIQVVAVCDVDTTRREHHKQKVEEFYAAKQDKTFKGCAAYTDFRELLERKDIDAVVIATPDHWHAYPVVAAANAGKDIYCEKPLSLTIHEARAMVNAVRKNERVFQTGSMQRSDGAFWKGCTLVRNGKIGRIKEVYANVGGPSKWCDLPEEPMEPGLDWNMWLGPAPQRPYNSVLSPRGVHTHFPNWRGYREYSGGGMTDWGAHHFDIAQWGLGMDESGPVEITPPDGKDIKQLRYTYANGSVLIHGGLKGYNFGVVFVGTDGKVCVDRGRFKAEPESLEKENFDALPVQLYKSNNHYKDFVDCIRTRKRPICDVEVGARSVTVCHLGNLAYWNTRALKWDPRTEQFIGDSEANTWRDYEERDPWKV